VEPVGVEIDHAAHGGLGDDDVVQGEIIGDLLAVAHERAGEHAAVADAVLAAQGALEIGVDLIGGDGREEAEAAEVDGDERNAAVADGAGGGKERAVAAEDDDELAIVGDFLARQALRADVGGSLQVEARGDAAGAQPIEDAGQKLSGGFDAGFGDDADGLNGVHAAGIPCCLRLRRWGFR
jgi:hypothetical protein